MFYEIVGRDPVFTPESTLELLKDIAEWLAEEGNAIKKARKFLESISPHHTHVDVCFYWENAPNEWVYISVSEFYIEIEVEREPSLKIDFAEVYEYDE